MDVTKMFEQLTHTDFFSEDSLKLLNKIMKIDNPMKFDDAFASDEDLNKLEEELSGLETRTPRAREFKNAVLQLPPCKAPDISFI